MQKFIRNYFLNQDRASNVPREDVVFTDDITFLCSQPAFTYLCIGNLACRNALIRRYCLTCPYFGNLI